jgi:glycosyltransferase involved in cell wall biosynthesis
MRVAFVSPATHHHGDAEHAHRLGAVAEDLAARGHDVTVCCAQWWDGTPGTFEHADVTYRAVTESLDGGGFGVRLPWVLHRLDPDVVHAAAARPGTVLAARAGSVLAGASVVADWYDPPADNPAGWTTRRAARWPATVVTPSRMVKTEVRELGAAGDDVTVIPTGVEMDRVRDVEPAGDADIVYSRRLDADANLESVLLALAEYRERDWTAAVIGDGPERDRYERQASDLRIDDRIEFVGDCSVDERLARFKRAHVYVQTARRASFALDLLRALACGCVGVVEYHAASSAHELVETEPRGFLATDDEALVDCVADAGDLPRKDVDESFARYARSEVLESYLDCYRDVQKEYGLM